MALLAPVFLCSLRPELRAAYEAPMLEQHLLRYVERARAAWPAFTVEPSNFICFIAGKAAEARPGLLPEPAEELYLACGCVEGNPGALASFEEVYLAEIPGLLANMPLPSDAATEVRSLIRGRL